MNIGSRAGAPVILAVWLDPSGANAGCGPREAWRSRKVGHAEKWAYADCVATSFLCIFPVLPDPDDRHDLSP